MFKDSARAFRPAALNGAIADLLKMNRWIGRSK
jgi:hypothetical protein